MGSIHWAGPALEEMSTLSVIPRPHAGPHRGTHTVVGRKIDFGMLKASDVSLIFLIVPKPPVF